MSRPQQLTAAAFALLAGLAAVACAGEPSESGLEEPLRLASGTFREGALPGKPPRDGEDDGELRLTTIETNNTVLRPGQVGKRISGRALDSGYAVAFRFEGLGTGYWVKHLDEADSAYPGELEFRLDFELAHDLPLGPRRLLFSVIDAKGRAGRQQALTVCVASRYDRELNACDPTKRPPAAIISLTWNTAADLDLIVRTPGGEVVDARNPSTLAEPSDDEDALESQGVLYTEDSRGCGGASAQREDLVFAREVPEGPYEVFVNLFDACGARTTYFQVRAYARVETGDGEYALELVEDEPALGQLIDEEANGGSRSGLSIVSYDLP